MNRIVVGMVSLELVAVIVTPSAQAQSVAPARTTDVGLAVGATVPQGNRLGSLDVGGGLNPGFTIAGSIGIQPIHSPVGYRLEAQYTHIGLDDERRVELGGEAPVIANGHVSVLSGTANIVLTVPTARRVRPYLIGGLGVYRLSSDIGYTTPEGAFIENRAPSPSETKFGLNGGAGLELAVGSLRTFVEARYHNVFAEDRHASFVPIVVGMKF